MTKINTYTLAGTKGSMIYPKSLEEKENLDLLAQAVRVYQDRTHPGLSKVKTRSEVDLTTAKVWRQKGTGRARHGARSAPIFVGGGVAHGPKGVKKTLKMSQKMAKKSLLIALSLKAKKGEIVIIKDLSKVKKTKEAQKLIDKILSKQDLKEKANVSLVIEKENVQAKKTFRNIGNVNVLNCENLGTPDMYLGGLLIFESKAFEAFKKAKASSERKTERTVTTKRAALNSKKSNAKKTTKVKENKVKTVKTNSKKRTK